MVLSVDMALVVSSSYYYISLDSNYLHIKSQSIHSYSTITGQAYWQSSAPVPACCSPVRLRIFSAMLLIPYSMLCSNPSPLPMECSSFCLQFFKPFQPSLHSCATIPSVRGSKLLPFHQSSHFLIVSANFHQSFLQLIALNFVGSHFPILDFIQLRTCLLFFLCSFWDFFELAHLDLYLPLFFLIF